MGRGRHFRRGVRARTYPSGRRVIEIQFSYRGLTCKETLKTLDPDKASHRKYANNLKAEITSKIDRGTFVYTDYFPNSRRARLFGPVTAQVTVEQAQDGILEDLRSTGSKEPTTLDQYERGARVINAHIGQLRLTDLSPDDIRQIIRERPVTKKTFDNYTIVLRKALRRAVNDGIIQASPMDRVELGDLFERRSRPQPDPFDLDEIDAILTAAAAHCDRMLNLVEVAIYTGLRIEELVALKWEDADLPGRKLQVRRAMLISLQQATTKRPKTPASRRDLDLLPQAVEALKRQRELTGWRRDWIFHQFTRQQPISDYRQINRRWTTVLKHAGVRYRPFKQCRHTFASHMLSSGVNHLLVAYMMGHSDTSKLDIYSRWIEDWKEEHPEGFGQGRVA